MEIDGNISKKSAECSGAYDISPPLKDSSSEYKDSKTVDSPIDRDKLQSNLDIGDSAASLKELDETRKSKEKLGENATILRSSEVTRNTEEPLQDNPVETEDYEEDVLDDLEVMKTVCSTPRKKEVGFETLHNNSYSDDNSKYDPNETERSYVDTNTLNLQHVVEALKTVASDVQDDSGSIVVPDVANSMTKSSIDDSGEYLDPSAYIKDFSKTASFVNLKNLMSKLLETEENKAVVRDLVKLYFENLNACLWGYFSQLKGEKSTEIFEEKISLGHLEIIIEGFRDGWMDTVDIMDLKDHSKDTNEEPEEASKKGNAITETISDPGESLYDNNTMETQGISMNLSSHSSMKKVDTENEVLRNKISRCGDNTYLRPKEPTNTDGATRTTVSRHKTAAIPEKTMKLIDNIFTIFACVTKLAPSNQKKPTKKHENSIGELKNSDDTKQLSALSYVEECVADEIEKHEQTEDSSNILVCSESECSIKKKELKKPNGNDVRTSSIHVHINDSNEGLEVTDNNENTTVCSGRGASYDLIVEPKELNDKNKIECSSQTGTSTEDPEKTEGEDISSYPVRVGTDLKVSLEVQKEVDSTEKSNAVFDRENFYLEESNHDLSEMDGTQATTASIEEDPDLQETNEEQKKTIDIDNYHCSANLDSILEVSIDEKKKTDSTKKQIAVIDKRDSDAEESIDEQKQIDATETTVTSFNKEDFDPEESNEEAKKTIDTDISPCSLIEGLDLGVSIEEQKEADNTKKSTGFFYKEDSHLEESIEDPKQLHSVETTAKCYNKEDSNHKELSLKILNTIEMMMIRSEEKRSYIKSNEPIEDIKKSNDNKISECRDRPDSDSKESYNEFHLSEDNEMILVSEKVCSDKKESKEPHDSEGITNFGRADDNPSDSKEVLEVTDNSEKTTSCPDNTDASDDLIVEPKECFIIGTLDESSSVIKPNDPNKVGNINISPCSTTADYELEGRKEFDPDVSIDEPKQFGVEATSSIEEEKDSDPQESKDHPKKTVDPDTYPCSVSPSSDLEVSSREQREADSIDKPTRDFDKDLSLGEEYNEKPEKVPSTEENTTNSDHEVSDQQESNEKTVDPDSHSCSVSSGSDLEVFIVEQKETEGTNKPTEDFNSEDLLEESVEEMKQAHGTETTKKTVTDILKTIQHLDKSDFNSNESIEKIKKLDYTELSSCTDGPDSEESNNELAPLENIEMSLNCSKKICSDMNEESKEPDDNVVMNNSDSPDFNRTYLNEESYITDIYENKSVIFGGKESSEPSIEEPTKIEGLMDKFACSNTEVSSLIESNVEPKEVEDYITTSSESADYGCKVSIREKNGDGLEMPASVDSNPIESVEELKYIDDADEIDTCYEDKDSSIKDSIEELKEIGDTEIVEEISDSYNCDPVNSNEEASKIEKIEDPEIGSFYIKTVGLKLNDLSEEAKQSDDSKPKETEISIKAAIVENISESSIDDNVPKETVRDPKTPDAIENASVCTDKAGYSSERLVEYPSTRSHDLSRPSPEKDESLNNINPASVWDVYDPVKRQKTEKAMNKICPLKGRKVASTCPESQEKVRGFLSRLIPPGPLSSDSAFGYDLYRLILIRKKYPKREFDAYPGSPFSVQMQKDVRLMLFFKEREMYFVAKQHKESPVEMAQKAVSHFIQRKFCPMSFLWLFLYICNHFALLAKVEDFQDLLPLIQILSKCIGDLRALGEFTDETWKDVETSAKSIAISLTLTVKNDEKA